MRDQMGGHIYSFFKKKAKAKQNPPHLSRLKLKLKLITLVGTRVCTVHLGISLSSH
jgi:hypothetical protein